MPSVIFPMRGARRTLRPSGATLSALTLASGLRNRGVDAAVVVSRDANSAADGAWWTGDLRETVGPWSDLAARFGLPCFTLELPYAGKGEPVDAERYRLMRKMARVHRRQLEALEANAVHTNDASMHGTWGAYAKEIGVPQVWHERGQFRHNSRAMELLLEARLVIAISEYVRQCSPQEIRGRCRVVHNPVQVPEPGNVANAKVRLRQQLGLPPDALVFGMVANSNARKRWDLFFEVALATVLTCDQLGRQTGFIAFGDGASVVAELKAQAELEPRIDKRIVTAGYVEEIAEKLAGLDALVHTAENEPLGRVLVESIQLGVPVFAHASGGAVELLETARDLFLVDRQDVGAYVRRCMDFIAAPSLYAAAAAALRDVFLVKFSPERHVDSVLSAYRDAGIRE